MIVDDLTFESLSKTFYNNGDCNSSEEYTIDIDKITLIFNHFTRYDLNRETNFSLLFNHFISFINCFGIISEGLIKYKIRGHDPKINSLFVLIGHKSFDGTFEIDEEFFLKLKKGFTNAN